MNSNLSRNVERVRHLIFNVYRYTFTAMHYPKDNKVIIGAALPLDQTLTIEIKAPGFRGYTMEWQLDDDKPQAGNLDDLADFLNNHRPSSNIVPIK